MDTMRLSQAPRTGVAPVGVAAVGRPGPGPRLTSPSLPQDRFAPSAGVSGSKVVSTAGPGRGFPTSGPWVTFYGEASKLGDLRSLAAKYRVLNIDADPSNYTPEQIQTLKAGGQNRVISYLNIGAVESFRDYWKTAPKGLVPAGKNKEAMVGNYHGYADEKWMDPGNPAWRKLVLDHIVPRLVAQGVDGFYLDNLELLGHGADAGHRPLSKASVQAGLDLIREIRERYPNLLIVLQNGTGPVTREGVTGGRRFAELIDGVAHESLFTQPSETNDARKAVYRIANDEEALAEMRAWKRLNLRPGGRPFHLSAQEYMGAKPTQAAMDQVRAKAKAEGFTLHIADKSAGMQSRAVVGMQGEG